MTTEKTPPPHMIVFLNSLDKKCAGGEFTKKEQDVLALLEAAPDLLTACKAQHDAIDTLLAMLITRDATFMPTKSTVWPKLLQGNAAIAKAEGHDA